MQGMANFDKKSYVIEAKKGLIGKAQKMWLGT